MYKTIPKVKEVVRGVKITEEDLNKYGENFSSFRDLQSGINQAQTTEIVTMILASAVKSNASDVHIEAEEQAIKVRFRIDGVLHDAAAIDKSSWGKIISRLKLLAGVKINVLDKPQDGRLSIYLKADRIDIRASFLPTNFGESVVMRLLRSSAVGLEFNDLGIRGRAFDQLKREVERPNGLVITTGPTGSGKTTTLYAILKKLNNQETKIITIEDPIEYQLSGVNQSQTSKNYAFAQGLRSIVRQDPDIIMVGEIRDLETAEIAIHASLTGHLVISTLHTNDAPTAITRLVDMGIERFLVASSLSAVVAQRLVPVLCQYHKEEYSPQSDEMSAFKQYNVRRLWKPVGCERCFKSGYHGRIGIFEFLIVDQDMHSVILKNPDSASLKGYALSKGMKTLKDDGLDKAAAGVTSLEEIIRVTQT